MKACFDEIPENFIFMHHTIKTDEIGFISTKQMHKAKDDHINNI